MSKFTEKQIEYLSESPNRIIMLKSPLENAVAPQANLNGPPSTSRNNESEFPETVKIESTRVSSKHLEKVKNKLASLQGTVTPSRVSRCRRKVIVEGNAKPVMNASSNSKKAIMRASPAPGNFSASQNIKKMDIKWKAPINLNSQHDQTSVILELNCRLIGTR